MANIEKYLYKGDIRYHFITLRGEHMIIKEKKITTMPDGSPIPTTTTCGGSYYAPVDWTTEEFIPISMKFRRAWKVEKDEGNAFYMMMQRVHGFRVYPVD